MPNYIQGGTRVTLEQPAPPSTPPQPDLNAQLNNGSLVLDSRRTRPLWFDGRFLAARDLEREQNYFLTRDADLGQAPGFKTLQGLMVEPLSNSQAASAETIVIRAGYGVTPAGELVTVPNDVTIQLSHIPEDRTMDLQLGLALPAQQPPQARSGLFVIALRPVRYTANPMVSFPTSIQGSRTTHDGDAVEAAAISLVPYPDPPSDFPAQLQHAALARQSFVTGTSATLSDVLLPLAIVSLNDRGAINWLDCYLVRRDLGRLSSGTGFGLADPATQQAFMLQYDTQLQSVVAMRQSSGLRANFAAADYFLAVPPAGRFPLDAIDTGSFAQVFFPQQIDVRISIVASDELAALLQDGMSLPPIDLTLPANAYANMAVLAFVPVPRNTFLAMKTSLPETPLNPTLPQVLAFRSPSQLLQLYQGRITVLPVPPVSNNAWAAAIGNQKYGFYLRRRSDPTLVTFKTPSGVALSSTPNPSVEGQTVTLTATVTPSSAAGIVQFEEGGAQFGGDVPLSSGVATLAVSTFKAGTHVITATYGGDATNVSATSPPLTLTVAKRASSTVVIPSANPSTVGVAVTLTATVTPSSATGSVQFQDGGNAVSGDVALSGGVATLTTTGLSVGTHMVTAVYSGDLDTAGSTSPQLSQIVNKVVSSATLVSSLNPSKVGQSVTFKATVSPSSATGSVRFLDGGTQIGGDVALSGGVAALTTSNLPVGTRTITAVYAGDLNTTASTSVPVTQTVSKAVSNLNATSSMNPSVAGQAVTFTALVTPTSATGTLQFSDGAALLGGALALSGGTATLTTAALSVGAHSITAAYGGDANNTSGVSTPLSQTVNKTTSSVTLVPSVNPSTVGQAVTFTATVAPASATGTVQFTDGSTSLGAAPVSGGSATLTTSTLTVGAHPITAAYSGDQITASSTSPAVSQTVNKIISTVNLISSLNPSVAGQAVTFTATVAPPSATGAVQFAEGSTVLGALPVSGGSATLTATSLAAGVHTITAAYAGDANDAASSSKPLMQTVNKAGSSVTVTPSVNPSLAGQVVTFTAAVTPGSATGSVQFADGGTPLGGAVAVSGGGGTFTTAALSVGTHSITAAYGGDGNDLPSTSPVLTQNVNKNSSTVTVTPSVNPSAVGQAVTFVARITPASATGTVQFTDGTTPINGPVAVSAGAATLASSSLTVGTHTISAAYSGDAANNPGTGTVSQTVRTGTTVQLTSGPNPSIAGQTVTFTVRVSPASATGSVQLRDGTALLGGPLPLSGGVATLPIQLPAVGAHLITASYSGDANNPSATSNTVTHNVTSAVLPGGLV